MSGACGTYGEKDVYTGLRWGNWKTRNTFENLLDRDKRRAVVDNVINCHIS
jgi:hypothetical protein